MSHVTRVIVAFRGGYSSVDEVCTILNEFINNHEEYRNWAMPFVDVNDQSLPPHWYGGNAPLGMGLFVAAFNHLNICEFVSYLRSAAWHDEDGLQLLLLDQDDDKFRLIDIH